MFSGLASLRSMGVGAMPLLQNERTVVSIERTELGVWLLVPDAEELKKRKANKRKRKTKQCEYHPSLEFASKPVVEDWAI
jgi:hypothetical protein